MGVLLVSSSGCVGGVFSIRGASDNCGQGSMCGLGRIVQGGADRV
jgi:hypothetical protein